MQFETYSKEHEFTECVEFDIPLLSYGQEIRDLCAKNTCGQYGKNHMCPPVVPDITVWQKEISTYQHARILTRVYPIKNCFDLKGMMAGGEHFTRTLGKLRKQIREDHPGRKFLCLGAGPCRICGVCTMIDDEPCRFPDEAFPSIEACGIDVMSLSRRAGVKYNNGVNTVTYLGLILYSSLSRG